VEANKGAEEQELRDK